MLTLKYVYLCYIWIAFENSIKVIFEIVSVLIKALLLAAVCRISPQCEQKQQLDLRAVDSDSRAGFSSQAPGAEGFSKPRIFLFSVLRMRSMVKAELFLSMAFVAGSEAECIGFRAERVHIEPDRSPVCVKTPFTK